MERDMWPSCSHHPGQSWGIQGQPALGWSTEDQNTNTRMRPADTTWSGHEPSQLSPVHIVNLQNEKINGGRLKPRGFGVLCYAVIENSTTCLSIKFLRKQNTSEAIKGRIKVLLHHLQIQPPTTLTYKVSDKSCIELLALEVQERLLFYSESKL